MPLIASGAIISHRKWVSVDFWLPPLAENDEHPYSDDLPLSDLRGLFLHFSCLCRGMPDFGAPSPIAGRLRGSQSLCLSQIRIASNRGHAGLLKRYSAKLADFIFEILAFVKYDSPLALPH